MAELLVRKIENGVKAKLKRPAAKQLEPAKGGLGSEIAALLSKVCLESGIPELRRVRVRPLCISRHDMEALTESCGGHQAVCNVEHPPCFLRGRGYFSPNAARFEIDRQQPLSFS